MLIAVVLSLAGAAMNAAASVCQRHESREEPDRPGSMLKMLLDLAARPVWWLGVAAMISGFGLEASALTVGRIAVVEPVMIAELPLSVIGAWMFLEQRLNRAGWLALLALAGGVALFVGALAPEGGDPVTVPASIWALAGGLTAGFAAVCTALAARWRRPRAALLGVATGTAFALTSVLISAIGAIYGIGGFALVATSWQTWAAIVVGPSSFFLLQSALQAGSLVASQPGFTLVNPLVAVLWGVLVFGETVRPGPWLAATSLAAIVVVAATLVLVHTQQDHPETEPHSQPDTQHCQTVTSATVPERG